ncbi:MAG: hypothetical protein JZU53_09630 [Paludibacter sp.]|nr:hypothetical protein [Paludibacter sp.]
MKNNYISKLHFISKHLFTLLVLALLFIGVGSVSGATYYSAGNNVPNIRTNWWTNTNGTGTNPANFTTAGNTFVIQSGHTMTTNANWTVSGAGSTIQINTGGTLVASNTVTTTIMTVASGGTYQHNRNGGTIPTATWNAGSNCTITGIKSATSLAGLGQTFGNFTWNCASQASGNFYLASNITTTGNFSVLSTGGNDPNSYSLRMSNNATSYTITVGGNFEISNTATFKMNNDAGSCTLNIANNLIINNGTTFTIVTGAANSTVNVAGAVNIAGRLNMQEEGSMTGTLNVKGNFSLTGTVSESATGIGAINFNGTTSQTYSKTGTILGAINFAVNNGATLDVGTSVIDGGGTFTLNSGASIITAHTQGLSTTASGATGSIQVTGARAYNTGANYTYNAAGAQDIGNGVTGANNLTLSGSGTKTLTSNFLTISGNLTLSGTATTTTVAALSIGGNLDIGNGTTLNVIDNNFTVVGNTKVGDGSSGTLNIITSTNGTKTFQGDVTINAGATWNNSINSAITFQGSLTNNSTTFTAGSGIHTFTGAAKTIGGTNANTIPSVTITGTYTNNGTLTVGTALSGAGSLTQAANATLNIGGTSTITGLTATNTGNTVNYTGAAQNIHSNDYYNLTFSGSGAKTAAAGLTIGGTVNIGSGTTFDGGAFTHTVAGDWTNSGTFTPGTSTLTMTGAGKTIGGSSTSTFNNLSTSGTASVSTAANITVANSLSIGNGTSFTTGAYNLTVTGNTTIGTGTLTIGAYNGTKIFKGLLLVNSGGTWNNSGNSPITFQGGITNNGTFTSGSGPYTFETNAQSLTGNINLTGAETNFNANVTNNGNLTLTAKVSGSGALINASTGTLNLASYTDITTLSNQGVMNMTGTNGINTSNFTNTGTINFNGTGYIANITNNAGGTVNINAVQNIGTINNAAGTSVLNINALTYTINTLTATAADNTVNYSGAGDQAIKNVPYSNLIVSGSGTKAFTGNTNIAKTFTNSGVIANLGTGANHTANSYYLGATEQAAGSWGGIGSGVTNTSTDFTATTATLNVANGACIAGTWKGTTDTNWNTATNWCGNVLPTSSTNVIIPNVTNKPTIIAAAVCNNITISAGSSLTISGTNNLTISGNFTNNGTFTANNSTVTFNGSTSQSIAGTTFYNLTVSGAGTKTFAATTTINNTFTNNSAVVNLGTGTHSANTYYLGATQQLMGSWGGNSSSAINKSANFADATGILNVTNGPCTAGYWKGTTSADWNNTANWCDNTLPTSATDVIIPASAPYQPIIGPAGGVCHNITIGSGATLTTADNVACSLTVYGNWVNNGTLLIGANKYSTVIFAGSSAQTIGGNSTSFYNITIQNTGGVTLNVPTTATRAILLTKGNLNTDATNLLTITNTANSGIMGGSAISYINGPVKWNLLSNISTAATYKFPVGNTTYLPYTLVNPITTNNPTAQVQAYTGNSGGTGSGISISNTEYWKLTTTGFSSTSVTLGKGDNTIYPYNVVATSTPQNGGYTTLDGTTGFYEVSNSTNTSGVNNFFTLGLNSIATINISPVVLGGFGYIFNFGPSAEQTFTVNGTSLPDNITITAPTEFEISTTTGIGFVQSITLNRDGSNRVNNVQLYIRLKAGLAIGKYNDKTITLTSSTTTKDITCSGTVFATTPSIITSGGRNCDGSAIILGSSSDDINILYWAGPNNYYSQEQNPTIAGPLNSNMFGTYTVTGSLPTGPNLIVNGTFEAGNVGFLSDYINSSYFPNYNQGTYAILDDSKTLNGDFKGLDSNDPGTKQMVIDGATIANVPVWSQTVKVVPNSTYQFTYWLQSVLIRNPSVIQLYANNIPIGTQFAADATLDTYKKYYYNWYSGSNTSVTLDLRNQNTIADGNDFALDNIDFRTVTQVSSSVEVKDDNIPLVSISTASTTVQSGSNVVFSATPTNGGSNPSYVWKVTNGASVVTFPSTNNSTFNYTPVTGDVISCVMTSNKSCAVPLTAISNNITMTVTGLNNYWKGTNSTVWNDPANWTKNAVPSSGDNVEFATTDNNGTAAQNDLYVDYNRIVGNLINNASGKNLVIPADKEVKVNNSITLTPVDAASTYDQIQIKCDPNPVNASRLPNGSLIFPNATDVNGTVEMYSKSYINSGATDDTQKYFWQYFGIPVETITAEPTLYGAYVRKSNESGIDDDSNYYWTELTNSSTLNAFEGFEICQPVATTYTFKGKLVNSSLNLTSLPYTAGAFYPGEHLLANPYTAAIDVSKMNFGTYVEAAVYLYNTGSYGQWSSASDFGNAAGQYQSIPKIPAGNNGLPQEVPSMSSMLIKVYPDNTGVSFNYSDVIKKNETIQRVKSIDAISNTDLVSTMIDLTGLHYSDRMWIFSEPSCTRNFDNGWDGRKILGSSLAPQIFAIEPDGDYQVNSVSDMHNTDLAFQAGDEVEYTLKFTHENIQRQYAGVYLVDLVENKTVDVSQNGSTYTFATAQSDAPAKRFKILTRSYEKGAPDKEAQVKIFTAPGRVFVHNLSTFKGECTLYDIAGRAIKIAPFEANAVTEVLNNLTPGAYVVNTITNGEKVSKRVIVQ